MAEKLLISDDHFMGFYGSIPDPSISPVSRLNKYIFLAHGLGSGFLGRKIVLQTDGPIETAWLNWMKFTHVRSCSNASDADDGRQSSQ